MSDTKHMTLCPICEIGWGVPVDEDGCCNTCGAPACGDGVDTVAGEVAAKDARIEELEGALQESDDYLRQHAESVRADAGSTYYDVATIDRILGDNRRALEVGDD